MLSIVRRVLARVPHRVDLRGVLGQGPPASAGHQHHPRFEVVADARAFAAMSGGMPRNVGDVVPIIGKIKEAVRRVQF
jgi:hypothetical protein